MKKILYVTDLDGTVMHSDKTISDNTALIINTILNEGALITYATARTIKSSSEITKKINFNIPVINRNSTVLSDPKTKEIIEIEEFSDEQILAIKDLLHNNNIPGFITSYIDGVETKSYIHNRTNKGFDKCLNEHKDDKRLRALVDDKNLYDGKVCYFTFIAEKEDLVPLYQKLNKDIRWNCIFQQDKYSSEYWLEICPKNATKAAAINTLKKVYCCDKVVVFGDLLNDISMSEIADEAYAVENAMDELKKVATGIIGSNDCDGVAEYLKNNCKKY